MWSIGPIGFATPLLLWALLLLPVIAVLLRAVPPAPVRQRFPGIALLLGLKDKEVQADHTPWWLLILRLLAIAALIIGFAGPVLNPREETVATSDRLLVIVDGTWGMAPDWEQTTQEISTYLDHAEREGRLVAISVLTDTPAIEGFDAPTVARTALGRVQPVAWEPQETDYTALADSLSGLNFDTVWFTDGLAREGQEMLANTLLKAGQLHISTLNRSIVGLRPARLLDGTITLTALRAGEESGPMKIRALGLDPAGIERVLAEAPLEFGQGALLQDVTFDLPSELRNRLTRFDIAGETSAGAVSLSGDALRRREVALLDSGTSREGLELLSPLHYLREALVPSADLIDGTLDQILLANPDVIVLADTAAFPPATTTALTEWIEAGGLLLRFAGPRLAADDRTGLELDPLLPVRLRTGGRTLGGAMSWGEPKMLAPFDDQSPFYGLSIPSDVNVRTQVLAQPGPDLSGHVIAQLTDGTPLVTRKALGLGQVVLFHVTANAEWSTLPLSGLFVEMLERLALSSGNPQALIETLEGAVWTPSQFLDGFGRLTPVDTVSGIDGEIVAKGIVGPDLQPGIYSANEQTIAINAIAQDQTLNAARWPAEAVLLGRSADTTRDLKGMLLVAALLLLLADLFAALSLTGKLRFSQAILLALGLNIFGQTAQAQDDRFALEATQNVVLAHVLTGDADLDERAHAGLLGLSLTLFQRTSVEPAEPMGVNIETDELALFPFLYWPISSNQPLPSAEGYAKLNRYLKSGGLILFDTRDADIADFGSGTPEAQKLRRIAIGLDIPPLEPIPQDHVLTRTFYLLQSFPGRYDSRDIWIEAAQSSAPQTEGLPFRILNDGVTPVVIGGNDWASAWAVDEQGNRLYPVGRGMAGEQQREYAYRFGVNLIMHVLTGNYKSDQVHVPALLDRLGQ